MTKKDPPVDLDTLVVGRLPTHVRDAIGEIEIKVKELGAWEASKPRIRLLLQDGYVVVDVHTRYSLKRLLRVLGAIVGLAIGAIPAINHLLPVLLQLLEGRL